jgi:hypothetical protein
MADGTRVIGDTVQIGNGSSVEQVFANTLLRGAEVVIRAGTGLPTLPLALVPCPLPAFACGGTDVQVPPNQTQGPLAPGVNGRLRVLNGASLTLAAGEFTFCDVKMGRDASVTTLGTSTLNVVGNLTVGTDSTLGPATGSEPVRVNVGGKLARLTQSAFANAVFVAPAARMSFGRDARLLGCFCSDRAKSDKHITLECPAP